MTQEGGSFELWFGKGQSCRGLGCLTADGILSHQLLLSWIFDFASSLIYKLEPLALLRTSLVLVYALGGDGFSKQG